MVTAKEITSHSSSNGSPNTSNKNSNRKNLNTTNIKNLTITNEKLGAMFGKALGQLQDAEFLPPTKEFFSKIVTSKPLLARSMAHDKPPGPLPTIPILLVTKLRECPISWVNKVFQVRRITRMRPLV